MVKCIVEVRPEKAWTPVVGPRNQRRSLKHPKRAKRGFCMYRNRLLSNNL